MNKEHPTSNIKRRTNRRFVQCVFGIAALATVFSAINASARSANDTESLLSYHSFESITTSNIFDPNRSLHHTEYAPPPPVPDSFALVGTMSYSKRKFAFFDSSRPEYKKVLRPGATIAGYIVKDITPKDVILAANSNELTMAVGTQIVVLTPNGKVK